MHDLGADAAGGAAGDTVGSEIVRGVGGRRMPSGLQVTTLHQRQHRHQDQQHDHQKLPSKIAAETPVAIAPGLFPVADAWLAQGTTAAAAAGAGDAAGGAASDVAGGGGESLNFAERDVRKALLQQCISAVQRSAQQQAAGPAVTVGGAGGGERTGDVDIDDDGDRTDGASPSPLGRQQHPAAGYIDFRRAGPSNPTAAASGGFGAAVYSGGHGSGSVAGHHLAGIGAGDGGGGASERGQQPQRRAPLMVGPGLSGRGWGMAMHARLSMEIEKQDVCGLLRVDRGRGRLSE